MVDGSSRLRGRVGTRVYLPAGTTSATSEIEVVQFAPVVTVTSEDCTLDADVAGSGDPGSRDGLVLTEWALAARDRDRGARLEGVVCFTCDSAGEHAVRVARRSRGTIVDEEWVLAGRHGPGEAVAAAVRLRCRELEAGDVFFAEVARLEAADTQRLRVTHSS